MSDATALDQTGPIRIDGWFQGPTGSGNGGWAAHRFASRLPGTVTTAIRAPVPLDTDLHVRPTDGGWDLVDPTEVVILSAAPWAPAFAATASVPLDAARSARARFSELVAEHPVPHCFSCGTHPDSMRVQAGPIDGDRFATDWRVPDWSVDERGEVDGGALWAALDCCSAWWVGFSREPRVAYTVQFAVEQVAPLQSGETYALVGWAGDHDPEWDGRKRRAASAAFDRDGHCVARSVSLWVAAGSA